MACTERMIGQCDKVAGGRRFTQKILVGKDRGIELMAAEIVIAEPVTSQDGGTTSRILNDEILVLFDGCLISVRRFGLLRFGLLRGFKDFRIDLPGAFFVINPVESPAADHRQYEEKNPRPGVDPALVPFHKSPGAQKDELQLIRLVELLFINLFSHRPAFSPYSGCRF